MTGITTLELPADPEPATGRDRILIEAAQLFLTSGYAETSLRTIADAVEMKPASIYHHFESKDALLAEILRIGMDAVNEAFDRAAPTRRESESRQERLIRHVTAHLDALFAHHAFTAAHVTVFPFVPKEVRRLAVPERDAYEARWNDLFAVLAPDLDSASIQLARLAAFGAMNATIQWFDPERGDIDALGAGLGSLLWRGIDRVGES